MSASEVACRRNNSVLLLLLSFTFLLNSHSQSQSHKISETPRNSKKFEELITVFPFQASFALKTFKFVNNSAACISIMSFKKEQLTELGPLKLNIGTWGNVNHAKLAVAVFINQSVDLLETLKFISASANISFRSLQFFVMIPSKAINELKKTSSALTLGPILEYGLAKLGNLENISNSFNLDSRLYLSVHEDFGEKAHVKAEVWEMYWIKEKPFVRLLIKEKSYKDLGSLMDAVDLEPPPINIRRQNWEGVNFTSAVFLAEMAEENNELLEASEASRHEVSVRRTKEGKLELMPSLSVKILRDFQTVLNFTPQVVPPFTYDESLVETFEKHKETFDIILSHFGIVAMKLEYSNFLLPTYYNSITAFFVQPPIHSFRNIFSRPLSPQMWVMIIASWFLIVVSFKIIIWIRGYLQADEKNDGDDVPFLDDRKVDEHVGKDIQWWAVAAACQQGWYITPTSLPTRAVFITGFLFSFLCYSSYTATIVSQLSQTTVPIKNIDQLLDITEEILFGGNSDVSAMIIKRMSSSRNLLKKVRLVSTQESVDRILRRNKGYSCHLGWPEYYTERVKKSLKLTSPDESDSFNMDERFCKEVSSFKYAHLPIKAAMLVPKNSPFVKILNYRIMIGWERGYIIRYWRDFEHHTKVHCTPETNMIYALGLSDVWVAFAILLLGYSSSISIMIMEILMNRKIQARQNKLMF